MSNCLDSDLSKLLITRQYLPMKLQVVDPVKGSLYNPVSLSYLQLVHNSFLRVKMGSNFCGFRSNGLSKKNSDDKNGSLTASMLECMKPRCLWAASKIKKKQSHRQENQQQNTCKVLTLEEWILSSPGFNVSKQCSSNRVHPSFEADHGDLVPESRDNISLEISMKVDEGEKGQLENPSLRRNQSGKTKKKVSFRSPEVAEIFILNPQQTHL